MDVKLLTSTKKDWFKSPWIKKNTKRLKETTPYNNLWENVHKIGYFQDETIQLFMGRKQISNLCDIIIDSENIEFGFFAQKKFKPQSLNALWVLSQLGKKSAFLFSEQEILQFFQLINYQSEISQNLSFMIERIFHNLKSRFGIHLIFSIFDFMINQKSNNSGVKICIDILRTVNEKFIKITEPQKTKFSEKIRGLMQIETTRTVKEKTIPIEFDRLYATIVFLIEKFFLVENINELKIIGHRRLIDTTISSEYDEILFKLGVNLDTPEYLADALVRKCPHCGNKRALVSCMNNMKQNRRNIVMKNLKILEENEEKEKIIENAPVGSNEKIELLPYKKKICLCNSIISNNDVNDTNNNLFKIGYKKRIEIYTKKMKTKEIKLDQYLILKDIEEIQRNNGKKNPRSRRINDYTSKVSNNKISQSKYKWDSNDYTINIPKKSKTLFVHGEKFAETPLNTMDEQFEINSKLKENPILLQFRIDKANNLIMPKTDSELMSINLDTKEQIIYKPKRFSCYYINTKYLVSANRNDSSIRIIDLKKGKKIKSYRSLPHKIKNVNVMDNVVIFNTQYFVALWNTKSKFQKIINGYTNIQRIKILPSETNSIGKLFQVFLQHDFYIIQLIVQCREKCKKFEIIEKKVFFDHENKVNKIWNFYVSDLFVITFSSEGSCTCKNLRYLIKVFNVKTTELISVIDFGLILRREKILPEFFFNPVFNSLSNISLHVLNNDFLIFNYGKRLFGINIFATNHLPLIWKEPDNKSILFTKIKQVNTTKEKNRLKLFYLTSREIREIDFTYSLKCSVCGNNFLPENAKRCKNGYVCYCSDDCLNKDSSNHRCINTQKKRKSNEDHYSNQFHPPKRTKL